MGEIHFATFDETVGEEDFAIVSLEMKNNRTENYRFKLPSAHRLNQINEMVAEPAIPQTRVGPGGIKLPNPDDVTYKRKLRAATDKRTRLHLAEALTEGGEYDIPGATLDEKADMLARMPAGRLNALARAFNELVFGIKPSYDGDPFRSLQPVSSSNDDDLSEDGLDA